MNSKVAGSFWKLYFQLPVAVQQLASRSYKLWRVNPPSIRFKPFKNDQWSVRVGDHYRPVGYFRGNDTFVWTWIGTHEAYNKL